MNRDEIKAAYSMYDIMGQYGIQIVSKNSTRWARCPFHNEKTASMQIFEKDCRCFGCGFNGDIFSFVQKMDNLTFPEAFQLLGGTYDKHDRHTAINLAIKRDRERRLKKEIELNFQFWKKERLDQICNLLRLYDKLTNYYDPFTDEWTAWINGKQLNEYKYNILAFGTRGEQDEMRGMDG